MSVHRGVPVVAAVERGCQLSRRCHIRIAVQAVANMVRVFLVDARKRKIGKPLSSVGVKRRWVCRSLCNTEFANSEDQKHRADGVFHEGYFRRMAPSAANQYLPAVAVRIALVHRTGMPTCRNRHNAATALRAEVL
jgi:hypothetical protein